MEAGAMFPYNGFPTAIDPKVQKRKIIYVACEYCRKAKKRCDGQIPCSLCQKRGSECRYPARGKKAAQDASSAIHGPIHSSPSDPSRRASHSVATLAGVRPHLQQGQRRVVSELEYRPQQRLQPDVYSSSAGLRHYDLDKDSIKFTLFEAFRGRIDPGYGFCFSDEDVLRSDQTRAARFRSFALFAVSSRSSLSSHEVPLAYLNEAKHLGGELMDDYSADSLAGFLLMSIYFAGQDMAVAAHYCRVAATLRERMSHCPSNLEIIVHSLKCCLKSASNLEWMTLVANQSDVHVTKLEEANRLISERNMSARGWEETIQCIRLAFCCIRAALIVFKNVMLRTFGSTEYTVNSARFVNYFRETVLATRIAPMLNYCNTILDELSNGSEPNFSLVYPLRVVHAALGVLSCRLFSLPDQMMSLIIRGLSVIKMAESEIVYAPFYVVHSLSLFGHTAAANREKSLCAEAIKYLSMLSGTFKIAELHLGQIQLQLSQTAVVPHPATSTPHLIEGRGNHASQPSSDTSNFSVCYVFSILTLAGKFFTEPAVKGGIAERASCCVSIRIPRGSDACICHRIPRWSEYLK